jgi:hypothetical protein
MPRRLLPAVALAFLAFVSIANATVSQTPDITDTHYSSILERVYPVVNGVRWKVIDLNDEIELINHSHQTVTVYGYPRSSANVAYDGGPYARIQPGGAVQVNENSRAYYLNDSFFADYANVPASATASGYPLDWVTLAKTGEFLWHDHRIHFTSPVRPAIVTNVHRRTLVLTWYVPIQVGSTRGYLYGKLYWNGEKSFSFPIGAIIAFIVVVLAGAALVIVVRRRRGGGATPKEAW